MRVTTIEHNSNANNTALIVALLGCYMAYTIGFKESHQITDTQMNWENWSAKHKQKNTKRKQTLNLRMKTISESAENGAIWGWRKCNQTYRQHNEMNKENGHFIFHLRISIRQTTLGPIFLHFCVRIIMKKRSQRNDSVYGTEITESSFRSK